MLLSCVALNQLATPGLGSIIAGHRIMGIGQLLLAATGFLMILHWFFQKMHDLVALVGNAPMPAHPYPWTGKVGVILFVISWIWAGVTSIAIYQEADKIL